jgi:1-phosphatidylinositol-4-phosphate 5-kinase
LDEILFELIFFVCDGCTSAAAGTEEEWSTTRGLVLVARDIGHGGSGTPGIHIRGSPLRASGAGDPEVDLLLPGTAR